ncbi:hypothetical protein BU24DRAFT_124713 [Aaosphaeria arxii CBS 175.79]|uniref:Uncharacterized protein n=1 Tax=Aaosphaeria arxii CBS 175.79 TaxID=1450172 RepID=A0A6A5Y2A9_9PLEO|nr:uncharacterized protein BU24DRAFT_124713 [Aaosphaeria arxii CBS 175.79]KAF2019662.1 hypothetical protein BU24DRAFT_124713 [Aaosphaeria arxii CBS 175.79]
MQAEIIKSLQLAVKNENAVLNLRLLHEASIMNRNESIVTLDEMKQRILITRPLKRTLSTSPQDRRDSRISVETVQTIRPGNNPPVPDSYAPSAVSNPAAVESKSAKTGLAKYLSMKRSGSQSSTSSQSPPPVTASGGFPFSPALQQLLQGPDRVSIMKDIDEIISSYQGLHMDDERRDTLAMLHGGHGAKRDTLAVLNAGDSYQRDMMGMNRDAMQMLRNLPPTPEEAHENKEYPAFNHDIFNPQRAYDQYFSKPNPPPQRQTSTESRWSASSSVYSDTVPPSLYSHDSASSRESPTPPYANDFHPTGSAPTQHFSQPHQSYNTPQPQPYHPAPRDLPTSSNAPFTIPPPTRTPPTRDDQNTNRAGNTRFHIVPDGSPISSASSTSTVIAPSGGISALAAAASSTMMATSTVPPLPPPKPASLNSNSSDQISIIRANPNTIRTNTIQGPTAAQEIMMSGRPCKDNNYWGFCKGAWAVREELKRGLQIQVRPDGMYNTHQVWQCRHCHFTGSTHTAIHASRKNKKETIVDPSVHTSAAGIRYKWIFLAKSHVKKKTLENARNPLARRKGEPEEDCNYGCVICSVEGNVTGIYGNVETLMNHIFMQHTQTMSERTMIKSRCVKGRRAGADEEWDINIPMNEIVQF